MVVQVKVSWYTSGWPEVGEIHLGSRVIIDYIGRQTELSTVSDVATVPLALVVREVQITLSFVPQVIIVLVSEYQIELCTALPTFV